MTGPEFEAFLREHERMVRALAFAYVRDWHAAQDVFQEVSIRAFKSLDTLRDPSKAKTWLYTMTRHAAIDHLRSRRKTEELPVDVPAPRPAETDDRAEQVMKVVDGLREDYRQLILLRYVDKMPYTQIAEVLGMTVTAVGEKLHRVRSMIASRL